MISIRKDDSFAGIRMPFGLLEVQYPAQSTWKPEAFEALKRAELSAIMEQAATYDRKAEFSADPYFRYFRKHKKTYPVMAQLESFLLKGRPFPEWSPINQVAFLAELKTRMLTGTHDVDTIQGTLTLFLADVETPFTGMGGRDCHCYVGDLTGRDDDGIILSMIAGPDHRTCLTDQSLHPVYMVFAPQDTAETAVSDCLDLMEGYIRTLAPDAVIERLIL